MSRLFNAKDFEKMGRLYYVEGLTWAIIAIRFGSRESTVRLAFQKYIKTIEGAKMFQQILFNKKNQLSKIAV